MSKTLSRKSYSSKLLLSHMAIAAIGSTLLLVAVLATAWLKTKITTLSQETAPTLSAAESALVGLQRSLASMRAWVSIEDESFKHERAKAWEEYILPSIAELKSRSANWASEEDILKLAQAEARLFELAEWQWAIEDVAHAPGNTPALYIYSTVFNKSYSQFISVVNNAVNAASLLPSSRVLTDYVNALTAIRTGIMDIRSELTTTLHSTSDFNFNNLENKLASIDKSLQKLLLLKKKLPNYSASEDDRLQQNYNIFKRTTNDVLIALATENKNMAIEWLAKEAVPRATLAAEFLSRIAEQQLQILEADARKAEVTSNNAIYLLLILFVFMLLSAFYIAYISAKRLMGPLQTLTQASHQLAQGELEYDIELNTNDELKDLADSFNVMRKTLQSSIAITSHQQLMQQRLTAVHDCMLGERSLNDIGSRILNYLVQEFHCEVGIFHFYNAESKDLECIAQYGLSQSLLGSHSSSTEGLVAQTLKNLQPITLDNVSFNHLDICTSLGASSPQKVIVAPIIFEQTSIAVFELATLKACFDEDLNAFIALANRSIAIGLAGASAAMKRKLLLQETQQQAEELSIQQEELRSSNEHLEEQSKRLKQSEEELRQQGEELRVNNDALQDNQCVLENQKLALEKAKKEVEIKAEQLVQSNKYKSEFLANMSHELRTPLNSFLLLSKSLSNNPEGNLTKAQVEDTKVIYEGGMDLLALINDIMDLSKVEAGMLEVHPEDVKISSFIQSLQKTFVPLAEHKGITFHTEINPALPDTFFVDGQRLGQIAKNFLSNAFKFTSEGGVSLSIEPCKAVGHLPESVRQQNDLLAMTVVDTGVGIPADKQEAIFEAFRQADGSTSRQYGGTGLGLSICRELARLLNGTIHLSSEQNKGSTFTLVLPMQGSTSAVGTQTSRPAPTVDIQTIKESGENFQAFIPDDREQAKKSSENTILIIEDNKPFAKTLASIVHNNGFICLIAGSGKEGLYLAMQYLPSGIMLDMGLPDISGLEVLEILKNNLETRRIPVHVISGGEHEKTSLQRGALSFVQKPASQPDIQKILDSFSQKNDKAQKQILAIEDTESGQHLIAEILADENPLITFADTAAEGIDQLEKKKYDCIILDLGLPDMSGIEVLEVISNSKLNETTPIIIYTGQEISPEIQSTISKYTNNIIIKGSDSAERLVDDIALFFHTVEQKSTQPHKNDLKTLYDQKGLFENKRVLLVDDDMRNAFALNSQMQKLGFIVEIADNGKIAIDKLNSEAEFDIILMDIMMPIMDGYEAMRRIRTMEQYKVCPIIALTAKAMPEDCALCIEAGASEYLTKPIDMEKLVNVIQVWLYGK